MKTILNRFDTTQNVFFTFYFYAFEGGTSSLDEAVFLFTQKYTGPISESAKETFMNNSKRVSTQDPTNSNIVSVLSDSGINTSIDNNNNIKFECDEFVETSTPKKGSRKDPPPKNTTKKKVYADQMHTSPEVCKIGFKKIVRMYYQNVRSIDSDEKMKNFNSTYVLDYDIVIFTETWLKEKSELKFRMNAFNEHFDVYRRDRGMETPKSRGGGVLIAVSTKLYNHQVYLNGFSHLEYICVNFVSSNKSIFLYCAYIPPVGKWLSEKDFLKISEEHLKAVRSIYLRENDVLIVVGDFNISNNNLVWYTEDNVTYLPKVEKETRSLRRKLDFLDKFKQKKLHQMNKVKNQKGNMLDLVFSNGKDEISVTELPKSRGPMSKLDEFHPPLEITFSTKNWRRSRSNECLI